jgi:prophage antirepressor-like protein
MLQKLLLEIFGENFSKIHRIKQQGQTWYKAKDVCALLDLKNTSNSVRGNPRIGYFAVESSDYLKINGVRGNPLYLSETGVFKVVLKCRKSSAYAIKVALSKDVLPKIMRSGIYTTREKIGEEKT